MLRISRWMQEQWRTWLQRKTSNTHTHTHTHSEYPEATCSSSLHASIKPDICPVYQSMWQRCIFARRNNSDSPTRAHPLKGESAWCSFTFRDSCLPESPRIPKWLRHVLTTRHVMSHVQSNQCYCMYCSAACFVCKIMKCLLVDCADTLISREQNTVQTV